MFDNFNNDIISSLAFESKFPVGSSASINAGLFIIALPIDTRCCCPPDNWFGRCFSLFSNPNVFISSSNLFSSTFCPSKSHGNVIFSLTFNIGIKL